MIQSVSSEKSNFQVKAINIPGFDIKNIEQYLQFDSTHSYPSTWTIKIVDESSFTINGQLIHLLNNRDASKLAWRSYDINYVVDTTGVYLTQDMCMNHNVDYVVMCAPAKDNTDQFVFNVNHHKYKGEHIISNASCTTNALAPVLHVLEENYGVERASFTTIHAATASQNTIDTNNFKNRTSRSILNNIIPHSTGANKSITKLIPSLANKVCGTSLRVPVCNVSIVDLVVLLSCDQEVTFEEVMQLFTKTPFIEVCKLKLVSTDYNTSTTPSIVDYNASMDLSGKNEYKIMIWYDNEYSYCAQVLRMLSHMIAYNDANSLLGRNKFFIEHLQKVNNFSYANKKVVLRVDWNIPTDENHQIVNDYRITSSMNTINFILKQNPEKVIIISHLGRPDPADSTTLEKYSWKHYMEQIGKYFNEKVDFLSKGLCNDTLTAIDQSDARILILENIRFHEEETKFTSITNIESREAYQVFMRLGDCFVNDAFGCCHRKHMSIVGLTSVPKAYGYLIEKELNFLDVIVKNKNHDKILAIIGGAKMKDKLNLCKELAQRVDGIYIAGGNINSIAYDESYANYIEELKQCGKAEIFLMKDGLSAIDLSSPAVYQKIGTNIIGPEDDKRVRTASIGSSADAHMNFYDIGMESIIELNDLIQQYDTIFWNGALGVVEHDLYSYGSTTLVNLLMKSNKKVIIGGGDTAGFVQRFQHNFQFVSTGGGATIDFISNGSLVGTDFFDDDSQQVDSNGAALPSPVDVKVNEK